MHHICPISHAYQTNIKINDSSSCCHCYFLLDDFPPTKPGAGLSNTKGSGKLAPGTSVYYKFFCLLHTGEYIQVYQEDGPRNTIDVDLTVREIVLGPQYNLQGGFLRVF